MNVLDHGSLEVIAHMGNDCTVANCARISFNKHITTMTDKDAKLIHYLAKNGHVSPFYHPQIQFRWKCPLSVQRQVERHRIGTTMNSESTRYIEVSKEFYMPDFREQSKDNKQGSADLVHTDDNSWLQSMRRKAYDEAWEQYQWEIKRGVAKELARDVLPMGTYTQFMWTASLAAVAHFIKLRTESHAQFEVAAYGHAMRELVTPLFPVSMAALLSHKEVPNSAIVLSERMKTRAKTFMGKLEHSPQEPSA